MIGVIGAGAFGTALALALGSGGKTIRLWARDGSAVAQMQKTRTTGGRLPGLALPKTVSVTAQLADFRNVEAVLLALPMQQLAAFCLGNAAALNGLALVACCKGLDLGTLMGPSALLSAAAPASPIAVLTGPSFAVDIARGLPTALTLACADALQGQRLQTLLATQNLRIYRTRDIRGAELGGALKNVIAIAAGMVIGAGYGESARAALITRGHAEMRLLALALGGQPETLAGLSGLGDLVLTCTSGQSRNFRYGMALVSGTPPDPSQTVEGVATAKAVSALAQQLVLDLPICTMVAAVLSGKISLQAATTALLQRPLKQE